MQEAIHRRMLWEIHQKKGSSISQLNLKEHARRFEALRQSNLTQMQDKRREELRVHLARMPQHRLPSLIVNPDGTVSSGFEGENSRLMKEKERQSRDRYYRAKQYGRIVRESY